MDTENHSTNIEKALVVMKKQNNFKIHRNSTKGNMPYGNYIMLEVQYQGAFTEGMPRD